MAVQDGGRGEGSSVSQPFDRNTFVGHLRKLELAVQLQLRSLVVLLNELHCKVRHCKRTARGKFEDIRHIHVECGRQNLC